MVPLDHLNSHIYSGSSHLVAHRFNVGEACRFTETLPHYYRDSYLANRHVLDVVPCYVPLAEQLSPSSGSCYFQPWTVDGFRPAPAFVKPSHSVCHSLGMDVNNNCLNLKNNNNCDIIIINNNINKNNNNDGFGSAVFRQFGVNGTTHVCTLIQSDDKSKYKMLQKLPTYFRVIECSQ